LKLPPRGAILFSASSFFVGGFFEKGKAKRTVLLGDAPDTALPPPQRRVFRV
jgi:hypothetical protein